MNDETRLADSPLTDDVTNGRLRPASSARNRVKRIGAVAVLSGLLALFPVIALAVVSGTFNDVPPSNPFYYDIQHAAQAGITSGCGGGNYCPTDPVTREQMAAFMNRLGSRAAYTSWGPTALTGSYANVATLTIKPGNVTGGTVFVKLDAGISAFVSSATGCPCVAIFRMQWAGGPSYSELQWVQVQGLASGESYGINSGGLSWVVAVPSGVTQTFYVQAEVAGTGSMQTRGQLSALYAPFGSTGANTLGFGGSSGPQSLDPAK